MAATVPLTAGLLRYTLFYVAYPITVTELVISVSTAAAAGSTLFAGIYSNDLSTGLPSTLLASGSATSTSTGIKIFSISAYLKPGNYWFALSNSGSPVVSSTGANNSFPGTNFNIGSNSITVLNAYGYTATYTHAALPSTAPLTSLSVLSVSPNYWFRVA